MPDFLSSIAGNLARLEGAGRDQNPLQSLVNTLEAAGKTAPGETAGTRTDVTESLGEGGLPPLEGGPVAPAFSEVLHDFLQRVNDAQNQSESMVEALALGEPVDVHQVMLSLTEARNAMDLTLQIRSHALKAYQELLQIPL